jgi:hypothetical protein
MQNNEFPWEYIDFFKILANDITLDKDNDVVPVFNEIGQQVYPFLIEELQVEIAEMIVEDFKSFLR